MIEDTLLVIDSYLSDQKRADSCLTIVNQLRKEFPENQILLINKSNKSFNLQEKVDYYLNLSKSFLVGAPPEEILAIEAYEKPYVYVGTSKGTFENWMPLTGVTDHVAGLYNSFIITSKFAKSLGFSKIFKVEYDTEFDTDELQIIKNHINSFEDYLFYGKRQEGEYAKDHHYLIDVHCIGYNAKLFEGFELVNGDSDFWELCKKINYYGKWIEYIIPGILQYQNQFSEKNIVGNNYPNPICNRFPKSKFDKINSPSWWTEKWKNPPLPCSIKKSREGYPDGINKNEIELFCWNDQDYLLDVQIKIFEDGKEIKSYNSQLLKNQWSSERLTIDTKIKILSIVTEGDSKPYTVEHIVEKDEIPILTLSLKEQ
tara:strand:- start:2110 stop:3222 length:1113 start_codon:yes stop_codon:yes gene_type:complete